VSDILTPTALNTKALGRPPAEIIARRLGQCLSQTSWDVPLLNGGPSEIYLPLFLFSTTRSSRDSVNLTSKTTSSSVGSRRV
jgi:hypothetical protein